MQTARARGGNVVGALIVAAVLVFSAATAHAGDVVVFAAASLKNALDDAGTAWQRETGKKIVISYAGSNALARQIEAGAPADVFLSADLGWMDYVASKKLIRTESRVNLLGNTLVLVAPKDAHAQIALQPGFDLAAALGQGRLAMAHTDAVPAGRYGKAALKKLGMWEDVRSRVAQADNVRAALLLVSRGEAPLGIVYRTDAVSDPNVKIVAAFPEGSHPPIVYPAALVLPEPTMEGAGDDDAASFLAFLRSDKARPFFERQGFTFVNKPGSTS